MFGVARVSSFGLLLASAFVVGCGIDSASTGGFTSSASGGGASGAAGTTGGPGAGEAGHDDAAGAGAGAGEGGEGGGGPSPSAGHAGAPAGAGGAASGAGGVGEVGGTSAGAAGLGGEAGDAGAGGAGEGGSAGAPDGATCGDGVKNGAESDVDCGLACPTRCVLGASCALGGDCLSGSCGASEPHTCVQSHCHDGVADLDETGVDCGGSCEGCPLGGACLKDSDCGPELVCGLGTCLPTGRTCLDILRHDPAAGDGLYVLDPDGVGPLAPFVTACDMQSDGGGWTAVLHADAPYTPTSDSVGYVGQPETTFAKLSDAAINALGPGARTFRLRADDDVNALYFLTSARFADTAPSWGITTETIGLVEWGPAFVPSQLTQTRWGGSVNRLDTLAFGLTGNDCSRLFLDYDGSVDCWKMDADKRCVTLGAVGCANKPSVRPFHLWLREWSPNEGLLFAHAFDEGAGLTTADDSGNGLGGVLTGAAQTSPMWVTEGHHGGALAFDGAGQTSVITTFPISQRQTKPPAPTRYVPTSNLAFSFWYRAKAGSTSAMQIMRVTGGGVDRLLSFDAGSKGISTYVWASGGGVVQTARPDDDAWHHVVWTFRQGVSWEVYVDGVFRGSGAGATTCGGGCSDFDWATQIVMGGGGAAGTGFTGLLDDVRVYQTALSAEDVKLLYQFQL